MAQAPFVIAVCGSSIRPYVRLGWLFWFVGFFIGLLLVMSAITDGKYDTIFLFHVVGGMILAVFLVIRRGNYCSSCDKVVHKDAIKNTFKGEFTAFSESTEKITSLNPALGFGASGKGGVMGIGATTSTSHIPIKLARYQCSVKCPECQHTYHWSQNIKVRIWTSPEGVESIEDLEPVSYPFKMV